MLLKDGLCAKVQAKVDLPKLTVVLVWVLLDDKHQEQRYLEKERICFTLQSIRK